MSSFTTTIKTYEESVKDFPKVIFKYRDRYKESNLKFIKEKEVFAAPPSSFDDEKDCKIRTAYDQLSDDEAYLVGKRIAKNYNEIMNENLDIEREAKEFVLEKKFKDPSFIADFLCHFNTKFNQIIGILCLTKNYNSAHLWKNYAENSTGFCIGYNSEKLFSYFSGGGEIVYEDILPIIKPEPIMEYNEIHAKTILYKESIWEHEEEYRLYKRFPKPCEFDDDSRKIKLPIEAYNCVIIGEHMEDKEQFKQFIKDNLGDIPIYDQNNLPTSF